MQTVLALGEILVATAPCASMILAVVAGVPTPWMHNGGGGGVERAWGGPAPSPLPPSAGKELAPYPRFGRVCFYCFQYATLYSACLMALRASPVSVHALRGRSAPCAAVIPSLSVRRASAADASATMADSDSTATWVGAGAAEAAKATQASASRRAMHSCT